MTAARGAAGGDPRATLDPATQGRDVRPIVARPRAGLTAPAITLIAVAAATLLFGLLEGRRRAAVVPAVTMSGAAEVIAAPPPLMIPAAPPTLAPPHAVTPSALEPHPTSAPVAPAAPPHALTSATAPARAIGPSVGIPATANAPANTPSTPAAARVAPGQALVVDTSSPAEADHGVDAAADEKNGGARRPALSTSRARAAMLANRATTVPQGTLIPAVLETGFDSTSPGFARALVQRDVRGFDGTRVLIPRGSRLIGDYGTDTQRGQNRAVILWSRLIRPDGVTIAIGSPAADPVGRGGVRADVNTHFLERFSGAILQSVLDLGVTMAGRGSRSPVIVALPGAGGRVAATVPATGSDIAPTLRVPPGRSVGVFVARDLDFTEAEATR
ncbi:TrbI/VirB10 family protein [Sphingomonas citri]